MKTLGDVLSFQRNLKGFTIRQLSDELQKNYDVKISASNLSKYEKNHMMPSADKLIVLQDYLKFTLSTDVIADIASNLKK